METEPQNQERPNDRTPTGEKPPLQPEKPATERAGQERRDDRRGRGGLRERVAEFLGFRRKSGRRDSKEIIINAESLEKRVAVLENNVLEELSIERTTDERLVGSVFKGRIKNLEHGLKAAFVDIGWAKNAFLHYWDIVPGTLDANFDPIEDEDEAKPEAPPPAQGGRRPPQRRRPREREQQQITPKDVEKMYPAGSEILVQVTKGPIGTKGPRITTNIAIPGRYLVLMPFSPQSGVSRKIEDVRERGRLKKIVRSLRVPKGMGIIVRTVGEGQRARYFVRDLSMLIDTWREVEKKIKEKHAPFTVYQEPGVVERTVRDFLTEEVDRIVIDNNDEYEKMRSMVGAISWRSKSKVELYEGDTPIFEKYGVEKQIEESFRHQVWLKCGGYIVIDETEAMIAIDVNTGRHKSAKDQEDTILRVNIEAADEICRQLRLRNIGGLIVIDFIDMRSRGHQMDVLNRMRDGLKRDKSKTHMLPISQLGLMEMTRQRQSESFSAAIYEDCPYCKGRGLVKSTESMSVVIQRKISELLKRYKDKAGSLSLRILVHPEVLQRLKNEDEKVLVEMEKKLQGKLQFRSDAGLHHEEFKVTNATTNEELK
ncbi:MAG: Rne/Rng family ribonuclease [Verrucomicrobiae bacterium]|nr:Rne/Rng family ribonuclease [Verrucomicrobiae bacterium]